MFELFSNILSESRVRLILKGHSEKETESFLAEAFEVSVMFGLGEFLKNIDEVASADLIKAIKKSDMEAVKTVVKAQDSVKKLIFNVSVKNKLAELLSEY